MRAVVQRVTDASVRVGDNVTGSIGPGLLVLLGISRDDTAEDVEYIFKKVINLRIFDDENGVMNLSLLETGGELLAVSQFTLYGDCRKGRRPSYDMAAKPDAAVGLYCMFVDKCRSEGIRIQEGVFRAIMTVSLNNDGPVTLLLDSRRQF